MRHDDELTVGQLRKMLKHLEKQLSDDTSFSILNDDQDGSVTFQFGENFEISAILQSYGSVTISEQIGVL